MEDRVDFSKVEKQIRRLPEHIEKKFFDWVDLIQDQNVGYLKCIKIHGYKDHALIGKRKGQRAIRLSVSYRVIYEVHKQKEIYAIKVEKVTKHDYR